MGLYPTAQAVVLSKLKKIQTNIGLKSSTAQMCKRVITYSTTKTRCPVGVHSGIWTQLGDHIYHRITLFNLFGDFNVLVVDGILIILLTFCVMHWVYDLLRNFDNQTNWTVRVIIYWPNDSPKKSPKPLKLTGCLTYWPLFAVILTISG